MGQKITEIAGEQGDSIAGTRDVGVASGSLDACDVVIDFSLPEGSLAIVREAVEADKPVVVGTTGHSEAEGDVLREAAKSIPLVWAGNYSVGVNVLFHLTRLAAGILAEGYDPEVIEAHHRHKKDAPSGTAMNLVDILRESYDGPARQGREGICGPRPAQEIGVHAIRGGEIVGDHTVLFAGAGDRLELTHRAQDRRVFAEGALRAARWAISQPPGLYAMEDVLGFRQRS